MIGDADWRLVVVFNAYVENIIYEINNYTPFFFWQRANNYTYFNIIYGNYTYLFDVKKERQLLFRWFSQQTFRITE